MGECSRIGVGLAAGLALAATPALAKRQPCPPERVAELTAVVADARGNIAVVIARLRGRLATADVKCWAATGDRRMQVELGKRLETGDGIAADIAAAEQLYEAAGKFHSGTFYIYSPGFNGSAGRVMSVRTGPDIPGLPDAEFLRARLHIEGRAVKPSYRKGLKILAGLAKRGHEPAAALLAELAARRA